MNQAIANRKIHFALVGCGRISRSHFDFIRQHADRYELMDACDIDPVALAKAVQATCAIGHATLAAPPQETRPTVSSSQPPAGH